MLAAAGAVMLAAGVYDRFFAPNSAVDYLAALEDPDDLEDEFVRRLRQPLADA